MKKLISKFSSFIFVFLFVFCFHQPVLAHGNEPRIEISADRLNPGAVLDIRGVDFEFEEEITLALIGSQVEIPLGVMTGDTEGIFLLTITLPADLTGGTYMIRATTDDHVVESPQITVWGTADLGGGEDGPREEDDGLLAPMPTQVPGVSSTPVLQAASPVESTVAQNLFTPVIWIAAGIGLLLVLGMIRKVMR